MIWQSAEQDIRINEINDDMLSFHMFTDNYIVGLVLLREEVESMCGSLSEWCGIPIFNNFNEKCDVERGCNDKHDDDISS